MNNIRIKSIFLLIAIVFASTLVVSCSNENDINQDEPKLDLSSKVLKYDELKLISQKVNKYKQEVAFKRIDARTAEVEMKELLNPLVENGEVLHSEMINFLEETGDFNNLSPSEQNEFLNLDEEQLAELSFTISSSYSAKMDPRIRNCVSTALGIGAIRDLVMNTAALGTVETTMAAIRLIGRRYIGWIGVAWMVMDFVDCMNSF
jgi:outer membrane murein-binding lipoprotein Lpp